MGPLHRLSVLDVITQPCLVNLPINLKYSHKMINPQLFINSLKTSRNQPFPMLLYKTLFKIISVTNSKYFLTFHLKCQHHDWFHHSFFCFDSSNSSSCAFNLTLLCVLTQGYVWVGMCLAIVHMKRVDSKMQKVEKILIL